jgi:hypothetical protein
MKLKTVTVAICLVVSPIIMAKDSSIINQLQQTPLTAYEAGKFKLESLALILGIAGEKKSGFPEFNVIEQNGMLGIEIVGPAKASKMSDQGCENYLSGFNDKFKVNKVPKILWPNLSDEKSLKIMDELFVKLTMQAEENSSFTVSCIKTLTQLAR